MDGRADDSADANPVQRADLPAGLTPGSTTLVACADDPSRDAVDLRILCRYGAGDETALVVSTTTGADETITTYDRLCPGSDRPSLGLVDTTSEGQSVSALYGGTPVVFTPSPGDIERVILGLSDLAGTAPPATGGRHLVVRSLTPILDSTSTAQVRTLLERITGLRSGTGCCLLGIDYTAHDEETMGAMADRVDGVLWVTRSDDGGLDFEFRPTGGRVGRPRFGTRTADRDR